MRWGDINAITSPPSPLYVPSAHTSTYYILLVLKTCSIWLFGMKLAPVIFLPYSFCYAFGLRLNANEDVNCYPCLNHLWPGECVDLTTLMHATSARSVWFPPHSFFCFSRMVFFRPAIVSAMRK